MTRRVTLRAGNRIMQVKPRLEALEDRNAPGQIPNMTGGSVWWEAAGLGQPAGTHPAMDLVQDTEPAALSLVRESGAARPAPVQDAPVFRKEPQAPVIIQSPSSTATGILDLLAEAGGATRGTVRIQGSTTAVVGVTSNSSNLVVQAAAVVPVPTVRGIITGAATSSTTNVFDQNSAAPPRAGMKAPPTDTAQTLHKAAAQSLRFEQNVGQADARVDFLLRGQGYNVFLTPSEAIWSFATPQTIEGQGGNRAAVRMQLNGANNDARAMGLDLLPGVSHYLLGNDRNQWHTNVHSFGQVVYQDVYDGIDLVYHGTGDRQLEYDFVVAPHADASVIQLSFAGVSGTRLDGVGNLVLTTDLGELTQQAPVLYQTTATGRRINVAGNYVLTGNGQVGFQVGSYDHSRPLVIDPVTIVHSTFLGGDSFDTANDVTTDRAGENDGNVYVVGTTQSADLPGPYGDDDELDEGSGGGGQDAFVTMYDPDGDLVFTTYLGGYGGVDPWDSEARSDWWGDEEGNGIAVDDDGNIYVTGWTGSFDFPVTSDVEGVDPYQDELYRAITPTGAEVNAFVSKLNSDGSELQYSTYVGRVNHGESVAYVENSTTYYYTFHEDREIGNDIVVDDDGRAYIVGETNGPEAHTAPFGHYPPDDAMHVHDAFIARIPTETTDTAIVHWNIGSHIVGGPNGDTFLEESTDSAQGIARDAEGNLYVTGWTMSSDYVVTSGTYQSSLSGAVDAFVTKLNDDLEVVWSTYLGTTEYTNPSQTGLPVMEGGYAIAVDQDGQAYVTGVSRSTTFPIVDGAFQEHGTGLSQDGGAFVTKFTDDGTDLIYSTYLGGPSTVGYGIDLGDGEDPVAFVTGVTANLAPGQQGGGGGIGGPGPGPSAPGTFPVTSNATQSTNGGTNAFLTEFNSDATDILFSTFHGGADNQGNSVAVRYNGETYDAVIVGETDHLLPLTSAAQSTYGGGRDGFLAQWTSL